MSESYLNRGVSAKKEDVHYAIRKLDKGLYPKMFCKVFEDVLGGDKDFVNIMSSDGSGTKSILAYLYWKATNDVSIWKGIAQDALVMNLDDLFCIGAKGPFLYSSIINRNKNRIPGEVLNEIINGTQEFIDTMQKHNVNIKLTGGETADLGDIVRTITVDGSMTGRMKKSELVFTNNIKPGQIIVGLSSSGQTTYETTYNSGMGSNGLTAARHDSLDNSYVWDFPETFESLLDKKFVYNGKYKIDAFVEHQVLGKLLLSPTRTYAPVLMKILNECFENVFSIVHNTGGGHGKVLHFAEKVNIIKNNLFPCPEIFRIIQESTETPWKEMYQIYNMGCRMEIYTNTIGAAKIIEIANSFKLDAQIIGTVEEDQDAKVSIISEFGTFMLE